MKPLLMTLIGLLAAPFSTAGPATFQADFIAAAHERTRHAVQYDGAYINITYPMGDVPADQGVCTDVLIRSYRAVGMDLQELVHEDLSRNFDAYPARRIWQQRGPDTNIDHRRVPNLQTFFSRKGQVLAISAVKEDYRAGEIVTWLLPGNLPHIGIVSDRISGETGNPLIIHNIGAGPKLEDMLFSYPITGHYQFPPDLSQTATQ